MKKILLLGATGMLGSAVYGVLQHNYRLVLGVRNPEKLALLDRIYCGIQKHTVVPFDAGAMYRDYLAKKGSPGEYFAEFLKRVGEIDYAINSIGVTIPHSLVDPAMTFFVNGALPNILAHTFGEKLIHITTDCVYNGRAGYPYNETSPKSPIDIYGLSKSVGEPSDCLTIRTSIIGRELDGFTGLLEWFLHQEGATVSGFVEHYWNGITTQQFGELCHRIMDSPEKFPRRGVYHVFSTAVSKYEMLLALQRKYKLRCRIEPKHNGHLNRTLATNKELNSMLQIPTFEDMVQALRP